MNIEEKLVWYIFDIYTSNDRNRPSYDSKHLNECPAAELQQVEVSEIFAHEGDTLPFTCVSAFISCPHKRSDLFRNRMFGHADNLKITANMMIND